MGQIPGIVNFILIDKYNPDQPCIDLQGCLVFLMIYILSMCLFFQVVAQLLNV